MLNTEMLRHARVHYLSGSFRLLSSGDYVVCAVSGQKIPLSQLRYWNPDAQEAYATAEIATRRFQQLVLKAS